MCIPYRFIIKVRKWNKIGYERYMYYTYRGDGYGDDAINIVKVEETAYWRQKGLLIKNYRTVFFFRKWSKEDKKFTFRYRHFVVVKSFANYAPYDNTYIYTYRKTRKNNNLPNKDRSKSFKFLRWNTRLYMRSLRQLLALENELKVSRWH
jgi:hypothetical protein